MQGIIALSLRRLREDESVVAAVIHRAAFDQCLPCLAGLHTPDEDRRFFREKVFRECEVWGAHDGARIVGIIALRQGWIDQLCVLPEAQTRGIGTALLSIARTRFPSLSLWTFRRNRLARRFYEARGFTAIGETDGSTNEEKEADILHSRSGPQRNHD